MLVTKGGTAESWSRNQFGVVLAVRQGRIHGRLAVVGFYVFLCIYHETIVLPKFTPISVDGAGPGRCGLSYMECVSQD